MKRIRTNNKAQLFFGVFAVLATISFLVLMSCYFIIKSQLATYEEQKYHEKDAIIARYCVDAQQDSSHIDLLSENKNSILLYIDQDGNIIQKSKDSNVSVPGDNLFSVLDKSTVYGKTVTEAKNSIVSGNEGSFEIYYDKQKKMLIYTPVRDNVHTIVRIVPTKDFKTYTTIFAFATYHELIFGLVLLIGMVAVVRMMCKYIDDIEKANERNDLIAKDNELVSYIYHSSIASFELTGAVESIFGADIGKRGKIDVNSLNDKLHADDRALLRNITKAMRDHENRYTTEFRMVDEEGVYHWYRLNGKSIVDDHGEVKKFVGTIQNSDDQIIHENMLKNKAEHDLLTGLLNKITTQEAIDNKVANNQHGAAAFYIIDLDNFKAVNDNLGHAVGDKVLTDVASKLQLVFNENDVIGRLGGDEFAVLLVIPPTMTSQAEKLISEKAAHVNEILRATYGNDEIEINVSASIGIAQCSEEIGSFEKLYKCADKALYRSKQKGKNCFTMYTGQE